MPSPIVVLPVKWRTFYAYPKLVNVINRDGNADYQIFISGKQFDAPKQIPSKGKRYPYKKDMHGLIPMHVPMFSLLAWPEAYGPTLYIFSNFSKAVCVASSLVIFTKYLPAAICPNLY
jgi:hypothetical protein